MKKIITLMALGLMMSRSVDDDMVQVEDQMLVTSDATAQCPGFTAGNDASSEILVEDAEAIGSNDELRKMYVRMLDAGVPTNGSYSPTIRQIVEDFNSGSKLRNFPTTYTVTNAEGCVDSAILSLKVVSNITEDPVCEINAGADAKFEMELSNVEAIPSNDEVRKLFLSKVEKGVARTGLFSPTIAQLVANFNSGNKIGEYSTTYTVKDGDCTDSAVITLVVIEDVVVCDLDAGDDSSLTLTVDEATAIPSVDELRKLYLDVASTNLPEEGTFSPSLESIIDGYNSGAKVGAYTTTYTISNSNGCEDSVNLTLNVVENPNNCSISAGQDKVQTISVSDATALPSNDEVKKAFLRMLDRGTLRNGTFSPSIKQIIIDFNSGSKLGDYTIVYTVKDGDCSDSTSLTLRVIED